MAVKTDIEYVHYRMEGNTARKVECYDEVEDAAPIFTPRAEKTRVIAVEPVAICGILLAVVMLFSMVAGLVQYRACLQRTELLSQYVQQLESKNELLSQEYHEGFDKDEIMDIAMSAGMVPADAVQTVQVSMQQPAQEEIHMSFWQTLTVFLAGIFA